MLDPQVKDFLDGLAIAQRPGWETMEPHEARQVFKTMEPLFAPHVEIQSVEDQKWNGVKVRVYRNSDDGKLPVVVYFHGGGWVLGDVDTHDTLCRRLALLSGCVIVSVDYPLSPHARFPTAANECYSIVEFIARHAKRLEVDPERICVAGDSAGGNLAASVSLAAKEKAGPSIALQLLIYPVIDSRCDSQSYEQYGDGFGLTKKGMQWFWGHYLEQPDHGDSPLASPCRSQDLANLPEAIVLIAEHDVLRDEGLAFSQQLLAAGVKCTVNHYDSLIHGFFHFGGVFQKGLEAVDETAQMLKDRLA